MATGDVKWFRQALLDLGEKIHDLSSDTYKIGIVTSSTVPSTTTSDPRWGSGGTTNFSSNQVATGTAYTGPITLTSVTWTLVSNVPTFRAANVTIAQDAGGGFTNGAYGIIYNDTAAGKQALGFIELSSGGALSNVSGSVTIDWNGASGDIFTITQS
jgi:hypothetical protein